MSAFDIPNTKSSQLLCQRYDFHVHHCWIGHRKADSKQAPLLQCKLLLRLLGLFSCNACHNNWPCEFSTYLFPSIWLSCVLIFCVLEQYIDGENPLAARLALLFILLVITALFYFSLYHFNQFAVLCNPKVLCPVYHSVVLF